MLRYFTALLASAALFFAPAYTARAQDSYISIPWSGAAPGYAGPGDVKTFSAWYSCARAYNAAYATALGLGCNLRNIATSEQCDVPFTSAGAIGLVENCTGASNGLTAAAFCALSSSSCTITKLYDQSGALACTGGVACDMSQSTTADQPPITFSCLNSLPCWKLTSASIQMFTPGGFTPSGSVVSYTTVMDRSSGTGAPTIMQAAGGGSTNRLTGKGGVANEIALGGTGTFNATASDAASHAVNAISGQGGTAAVVNVDGSETTGSTGVPLTAAGVLGMFGVASTTLEMGEDGVLIGTLTSTQRTNLCHNQRLFWATPGSC